MPARAPRRLALAAAAAFSLSATRASTAPAPPAESGPTDGGNLRAGKVIVPPSVVQRRAAETPQTDPLSALGSPEVLAALGDFHPDIGSWAEYSVSEHGAQTSRFLVSVLPPPMPDGCYWMEIDTIDVETLPIAMKMLVHGNPTHASNIDRALIQVPGQSLFEVPFSALPQASRNAEHPASGAKVTTVPHVKLKVKAGTFNTDRIHVVVKGKENYTVWRSTEVPLFGLVRGEGAGKITELVAMGRSGAHSLISQPVIDENIPPRRSSEDALSPGNGAPPAQGNGSDNK